MCFLLVITWPISASDTAHTMFTNSLMYIAFYTNAAKAGRHDLCINTAVETNSHLRLLWSVDLEKNMYILELQAFPGEKNVCINFIYHFKS